MSIVVLQLPDVKRQIATRPPNARIVPAQPSNAGVQSENQCGIPVCSVKVYGYRCCHCHRTFRHYPQGLDQADRTHRLRKLAAICWSLGCSYRSLAAVLAVFIVQLSRMTAWRDIQAQAEHVKQRRQ